MSQVWAGVDAGKGHHHCVVINTGGKRLLSRRVANDEPDLLALVSDVVALADEVTWAVDLPDGGAALLIGLLVARDQAVLYIPGRTGSAARTGGGGDMADDIDRKQAARDFAAMVTPKLQATIDAHQVLTSLPPGQTPHYPVKPPADGG